MGRRATVGTRPKEEGIEEDGVDPSMVDGTR
jgi:hypothetical protein